jgi:hypothetical protein
MSPVTVNVAHSRYCVPTYLLELSESCGVLLNTRAILGALLKIISFKVTRVATLCSRAVAAALSSPINRPQRLEKRTTKTKLSGTGYYGWSVLPWPDCRVWLTA